MTVLAVFLYFASAFLEVQGFVAHPAHYAIYWGFLSAPIAAYAAFAWILCRAATRGFDAVAGRPLLGAGRPPHEAALPEGRPKLRRVRRMLR